MNFLFWIYYPVVGAVEILKGNRDGSMLAACSEALSQDAGQEQETTDPSLLLSHCGVPSC